MSDMNSQLQEPNTSQDQGPGIASSKIKIAPPDVFDGTNPSKAKIFITQLYLYFKGKKITDDDARIIMALSYMKGDKVEAWVQETTETFATEELTWDAFYTKFQESFGDPAPDITARNKMKLLKQGTHTADEYVSSFNQLKRATGFNDAALVERFKEGLNPALVDKVYSLPEMPTDLRGWTSWATKLDRQWRQRDAEKKQVAATSQKQVSTSVRPTSTRVNQSSPPPVRAIHLAPQASPKEADVVPMEIDSGWKKIKSITCYRCRQPGHIARNCPGNVSINRVDYDSFKAQMFQDLEKEGYIIIKRELEKEASLSNKEDF
jgi:hypothetical protein